MVFYTLSRMCPTFYPSLTQTHPTCPTISEAALLAGVADHPSGISGRFGQWPMNGPALAPLIVERMDLNGVPYCGRVG